MDRNEDSEDVVVMGKVVPDQKDVEIARLKLQLAESEKQLRIQTQVTKLNYFFADNFRGSNL